MVDTKVSIEDVEDVLERTEIHHPQRTWILDDLRLYNLALEYLEDGMRVLDAGCNKGYGALLMAKHLPSSKFIGIDISSKAIDFASSNIKTENMDFKVEDILDPDFSSSIIQEHGVFDAVVCFEVIEHIDPEKSPDFINSLRSVLKDDGLLFLSTPNKPVYDLLTYTDSHTNEMDAAQLSSLIQENGFRTLDVYGAFAYSKTAVHLLSRVEKWLGGHFRNDKEHLGAKFFRLFKHSTAMILSPGKIYEILLFHLSERKWMRRKWSTEISSENIHLAKWLFFVLRKDEESIS